MEVQEIFLQAKDWGNPRDSIIRGHQRGPVQEVKNKLQKWCEVVDVDEFHTSKLCYHCHCEMSKVKFNGKEINSVLHCSNNECGITIDHDINGARNIFMLFKKIIQKERRPEAFCRSKINGFSNNSKP
jgi:transposase